MKRSRARSPEAIEFARTSAQVPTNSPPPLWQWFRNRQICNQKFRREYPIPPYTADFCCVELKLIIEVDGTEHFTEAGKERDVVRDECLSRQGYRIVRIAGFDVLREPDAVLKRIEKVVRERMAEVSPSPLSPSPPTPLPETG